MVVGVAALQAPAHAGASAPPGVTIMVLPKGTTPQDLASIPGAALGVMSAGIGRVSPEQTYLDIGQGNRLNPSLYDGDLPKTRDWPAIVARARAAPAEIEPGLLASTLDGGGLHIAARGDRGAGVIGLNESGKVFGYAGRMFSGGSAAARCGEAACIDSGSVAEAARLARQAPPGDLLIAFARPPPERNHELPIAIAGSGFSGDLTSESTHTDGLVLTTDIAPTILDRLGVAVPDAMAGQPITASGAADAKAITDLENRLAQVGPRRHTVIGVNLLIWLGVALLAAAITRRRGLGVVIPLLASTLAFAPALMLIAPAFHPSELAERLIVGLGAPGLAALSSTFAGPWGALALGAAATVGGYAIDVIAGSSLTSQSLVGPNPSLGVRFYGIGNELEATIAVLAFAGTGAALQRWTPRLDPRRAALAFAAVGVATVIAFAPGRFGADVGAAIDLPIGAAAAAAVCIGARRRRVLLILALPIAVLAFLAIADLVTGGGSHLTRSVLQAGGLHNLGDVAERRLRLGARSFVEFATRADFLVAVAVAILAVWQRRRIRSWFDGQPLAWAGLVGSVAAIAVGTVANDSAAIVLMIGTTLIIATCGVAYARTLGAQARTPENPSDRRGPAIT